MENPFPTPTDTPCTIHFSIIIFVQFVSCYVENKIFQYFSYFFITIAGIYLCMALGYTKGEKKTEWMAI